ncbi:hypothetical protein Pmar_PMAR023842 [Perkinsus marinus ATCC 50983]|uniref:Uncharacterized protein n=1 Tax=Perkinsus marinus (strain ATCC 50983 / TXsc) TaxID=423536 RepID=C5LVW9_PERM5|nr:hypothetical protein Pmar_PMAR023842 [Perkinsus marinus ATCC 50983]EEQ99120.1 hypothetical protein Pmar_PMAR023842 [Perkinsus marinus ATCC 50983]|eukprot:XP_002766403.1 hypothetical protein Pmar_PMAR023842 [Perkinsus marinus ATCC 50983]
MRLSVRVIDVEFDIEVGKGLQHARWLGLLAATRYAELSPGPAAFLIPTAVKTVEGRFIQPHQSLKEALADGGDTLVVELAIRGEALSKMVSRDDTV